MATEVVEIFTVLDSSAHLNAGILAGNINFLGSFDSCLEVNVKGFHENGRTVEGFR